jgi:endonuclease-3
LRAIAGGGILPDNQVDKLRRPAQLANDSNLDGLNRMSLRDSTRALMKFPSIGEPGAEKILLFARTHAVLGLESNGVRVLTRLGLVEEDRSYARTCRNVQRWAADYVERGTEWLIRAHQLLRQHGQELCRRTRPRCEQCRLRNGCRFYARAVR